MPIPKMMPTKSAPYVLISTPPSIDAASGAREQRERFMKYREAMDAADEMMACDYECSLLTYVGPGMNPECEDL